MSSLRTGVVLLALAALPAQGLGQTPAPTVVTAPARQVERLNPGREPWERVPRERVAELCGLDPALLERADAILAETPYAVVRYGRLCWEHGATTEPYPVMSITKTMGSLLFGITAYRSSLSDEDPVTRWIPAEELGQINPEARLAHVLSMTATSPDLAWGKKAPWRYDATGNREINRLVGVMDRAIAAEPAGFPGIASACDLARVALFERLGMVDSSWCSEAIGYGMTSTVRDMARMSLLILQRGWYDGERLVSEEYMYRMTHPAFPDANTAYGYLLYNNALENWRYSTGANDPVGSPVALWPTYPHPPFFEAVDCNAAYPSCSTPLDVGANWGQGAGGQRLVVHRALDLVMAIRDDDTNMGHVNVWNAVRPALVALDPVFRGDQAGFLEVYTAGRYAPDLARVAAEGAGRP